MSRPPKRKPDRTSTVVAGGLVLLAGLGVVTIFWGPLLALVEPSGAAEPAAAAAPSAPPGAASAPSPPSTSTTSVGRGDGGAHS
jgi:hypothetical protein